MAHFIRLTNYDGSESYCINLDAISYIDLNQCVYQDKTYYTIFMNRQNGIDVSRDGLQQVLNALKQFGYM